MTVAAETGSALGPWRVRSLAAAIGCVTCVGVGLSLSIPLLSLEMERMGVSSTLIGVNTAVAGLASIVAIPFVPRLAARIGVMPLIWGSVAAGALTLVGFKALFAFAWWFPLRFVFSAAIGILFVLSEYWITAAAPPERRGLVMGIYASVLALGFAGGPAILAAVGTSGWPPYLAGAALFALAALPLALGRGLTPEARGGRGRSVLSFLRAAPVATLAALIFGAVETGGFALLALYGLRLGYSPETAAYLLTAVALGNVLFQIPIGLLSDRLDRRLVLLASGLAGCVGAALLPALAASPAALIGVLFLWGGLVGALYTVGLAHLGVSFSGSDLVSANAAFVILYNVGLTIGPPLVGAGMDAIPPHGFAWTLYAFCAAYVAAVGWRLATGRR